MSCTEDVFAIPPFNAALIDPVSLLVTELRETNRLLAALIARDQSAAPAARQDPRRYQTVDAPR